ncbi:DUF6326 family protein [Arthrobacter agilis]|uniref:DUF6326 family protein n=1 Tax=Arthrobacter agilis TaxID=37921 RepID=UPI002786407A|nr:DUF6326 family protein [Arthrobacter agilis]MDQ0735643.1 phage shock protein PspC (stress-responsive transcriptional regulator) [Arthrobacter agilis]
MRTPQSRTALKNPRFRSPLEDRLIPVQARIAAAWTTFMFLYIYVDIFNLYKPGVVDGILNGLVWRFDISATLLTIFLVSVSIPALMVVLSMMLPARMNRATNLVVASLLIPYSMFNAAGATWEWAAFYGISIGIEVLLLVFILRSAWAWPRRTTPSATRTTSVDDELHHTPQQT